LAFFKPFSESGRIITWKFFPSIYIKEGFQQPFHLGVSQETIDKRGKKGSKSTQKVEVGKEPIPKGPSPFVQVFRFGDEVQFGDIYARGTGQIAEVASHTEVDPFIDRTLPWFSESFRTRACLLGPGKLWGHS
jgi:hypothetical protein